MILGSLAHSAVYDVLSPRFAAAFRWLREQKTSDLPVGRINVLGPDGDEVHAMIQDNAMKPEPACRWEAHRKYADIQLVVRGVERMGVGQIEGFTERSAFDVGRDVAFYSPSPESATSVLKVAPGEFALFLPEDVHMPLIAGDGNEGTIVRKIVMKVKVGA